jgi:RNA polymerase sigma-70 factor (ECF subfamily)
MPPPDDTRRRIEEQRAVQETLLAALGAEASYAGRSELRTWLTGILKHKIIDAIRRANREPRALLDDADDGAELEELFDRSGHWAAPVPAWREPDASLEQAQFFEVLEACLQALPAKTARAFMMREHMGLETDEICKELGITPTNCWVMLYRARMALRLCLEARWFGAQGTPRK